MDELEELRRLLLGREQHELRKLRSRVEEREPRARDVASVLPQAVQLSRERGDELSKALQPAVEATVRQSIEKRPQVLIDALHPILGGLVRRAVAQKFRGLLQSLNQTLEHTFSWRGLKWRWEALRTGQSFAQIVLLRSLVYRVKEVFLIHQRTSLPLLHVSADAAPTQDSSLVAGMLSAIQDFAHDSFGGKEGGGLEEFRVGELEVWMAPGPLAYLAAAIEGAPPRELRETLDEALADIHVLKGPALAGFAGDPAPFESLRPQLEGCLLAQYGAAAGEGRRLALAWLAVGTAVLLLLAGLLLGAAALWRSTQRWQEFVESLRMQPGLAVASARQSWISPSQVTVLRDPLAADRAALQGQARRAGVGQVQFHLKEYLALDSAIVERRVLERFGPPGKGAQISSVNGRLTLSGPVPYEWLERFRREAWQVPGVAAVAEQGVTVIYDPALSLARFEAAFPLPQGVKAAVRDGVLRLSGKTSYEWLAAVRSGAKEIPGIHSVSEEGVAVEFDPARVLHRLEDKLGLPDSVTASVQAGVLTLSGEASHRWLERVRQAVRPDASELPGVTTLNDAAVIDLDRRGYQQAKSVIESAYIYFLLNKDKFATEGFAALSRLPDEIRQCQGAGRRLGQEVAIEIRGYADAVGPAEKNLDLSKRRAVAVQEFLVSCGLDAAALKVAPMGAPSPALDAAGKPLPEQADRRVAFRVLARP